VKKADLNAAGPDSQRELEFGSFLKRGLVLLGCGKMGSALLNGWLNGGLDKSLVHVVEPFPSAWLIEKDVKIGPLTREANPAFCVVAVKPQMMADALVALEPLRGKGTVILSIAAGTRIAYFQKALGAGMPIVRAMPNTPAAVGRGISALVANRNVTGTQLDQAEVLMRAVGETVRMRDESQIDVVTAVSGSGPAYVFHLIEALSQAAVSEGLPRDVSLKLAMATVAGAGWLAKVDPKPVEQLRRDVTSPGGTTEAALKHLMAPETGLTALIERTVHAAVVRGRELGKLND